MRLWGKKGWLCHYCQRAKCLEKGRGASTFKNDSLSHISSVGRALKKLNRVMFHFFFPLPQPRMSLKMESKTWALATLKLALRKTLVRFSVYIKGIL